MTGQTPSVVPMIAYEDGFSALDWLARAFDFRERMRMARNDGGRVAQFVERQAPS